MRATACDSSPRVLGLGPETNADAAQGESWVLGLDEIKTGWVLIWT